MASSLNTISVAILAHSIHNVACMDIPLGPGPVGPAPRGRTSGGAKRKARNALPQVLLVKDKQTGDVSAAVLVVAVSQLSQSGRFIAVLGGVAALRDVKHIVGTHQCFKGSVVRLKPEIEGEIRTSPSTTGGTLNDHFGAYCASVWRCVNLAHD